MNYSFDFASVFRNFGPLWEGLWLRFNSRSRPTSLG